MKAFVTTNEFKALNVGFSLDEGIASPNEEFDVFYAERSVWRKSVFFAYLNHLINDHINVITGANFKCSGTTGHGSLLHKNTAAEKIRFIIDKMMDYRQGQVQKLENNPEFMIGDVTTVNLTILSGGLQINIVPAMLTASFDIRLALDVDHSEFEAMVRIVF